ncbi:hypothetical protein EBR43_05910 [bacterium]|jgi:hypothetical protein|nr:hypothetical protein [bacterium]
MINESTLLHYYQAWQQDNDHYISRWRVFVQIIADLELKSFDEIFEQLIKYSWFEYKCSLLRF